MRTAPVMIMAGGTGGHVYPALAVAEALRLKQIPVVWLGTRRGLEARVVPENGFAIEWLSVSGLRGKSRLQTFVLGPAKLVLALLQASWYLLKHRPRAVLGMGGFVSGPGGLMSFVFARRLFLHEQNSILGLTNRLLKPLARRLYLGFPLNLSGPVEWIGNPVREAFYQQLPPSQRLAERVGKRARVLILGGSLGARSLNQQVPAALAMMPESERPQIRHQCGPKHLAEAQKAYQQAAVDADVVAFIDDMAEAYAWADLVVCRSGALTLAEICAVGVASILVPYPYAVDDHQWHNAEYLQQAGAARLLRDSELSAERLMTLLDELLSAPQTLLTMATAATTLAQPHPELRLAETCIGEEQ